jgi:glycosyltransferase involved in cell wall biosynthesis
MKIAVVSAFYSEGMGYVENCLPRALAALGHEVHVIASTYNVYGNSPDYVATYQSFLGPADQGVRSFAVDGYTVHRLASRLIQGYVWMQGLAEQVRRLSPQVVHCTEIGSLQCFALAAVRPFLGFKLFTETHQHLSVVKPHLLRDGAWLKKMAYGLTRTLPTRLASAAVERCYAIAPDCVDVATRFYGVPARKIKLQSLGTDTLLFKPASSPEEVRRRQATRTRLGFVDDDIVCVYTGRFSNDKNPLALAQAVQRLAAEGARCKSVFVGEGPQKDAIAGCKGSTLLPFMRHSELADLYRAADIAVWPRQESMSMLDAAASGLPLIVSDKMGESERVAGNGEVYRENDVEDLACALVRLSDGSRRNQLGAYGREKMLRSFSWSTIAASIASDYVQAGVADSSAPSTASAS